MKLLSKSLITPLLIGLISACSSGGSEKSQAEQDNLDLFTYLKTDYFWNASLPAEINTATWSTMPDAMKALRAPQDRFSFVMTNAEYADYVAAVFFGYGFSHKVTENKDGLLIRYVYDEGSAYKNGLRRGDIITHVAGTSIAEALSAGTELSELFGPNEDGYTVDVTFKTPGAGSNLVTETKFTKSSISANTVMAAQVKDVTINDKSVKVGYLVFDSFKEKSEQELDTAFDMFDAQGVKELILDLRYNSGGRINIAQQLSQQIGGSHVDNEIFVQYVHNALQTSKNSTSYFNLGANFEQLSLNRVVVLTSGETCSASELVINSLNPFIEVTVVGSETCGKPIGMYPTQINDWTVFAINFQTQNAVGFGDYFNGFAPDCPAVETIPGDWGDESEALLAEGIYYLQNDKCRGNANGVNSVLKATKKVDFSLGPLKVRNAL